MRVLGFVLVLCFTTIPAALAQTADETAASVTSDVAAAVAPVASPVIAQVATQSVETPYVGTYDMSGGLAGTLVVKRADDDVLAFEAHVGGKSSSLEASVSGSHDWRLDLGETVSVGLVGALGHSHGSGSTSSSRTLVLRTSGPNLLAMVAVNGHPTQTVVLKRKLEALVVYGTYMKAMKVYAQQVEAYYKAKGYSVKLMPGSWQTVTAELVAAPTRGDAYERFVIVSHGGWDGPMLESGDYYQVSAGENGVQFGDFVRAVRRGTTPDAQLIFSCCHQGGSNKFENKYEYYASLGYPDYRYTDDLSTRTGRLVAGPMGETSTEYSLRLVKAIEGEGPAVQDTRVSTPSSVRQLAPGTELASAQTLQVPGR
jgi:hypothetical protein